MTDHNADASNKVEPCAWCGKEPRHNEDYDIHWCGSPPCPAYEGLDPCLSWNDTQQRILAQRRKDFEAGHYCASTGEFMPEKNDFDDYLARTRK